MKRSSIQFGLVVVCGLVANGALASGRHPPCPQCTANEYLNNDVAFFKQVGDGFNPVFKGEFTSAFDHVSNVTAWGFAGGGTYDDIYISWRPAPRPVLSLPLINGNIDRPTRAIVDLFLPSNRDINPDAQAIIPLPDDDRFVMAMDLDQNQHSWIVRSFTMNGIELQGSQPDRVSGHFERLGTIDLNTALALEAFGLWRGEPLTGHLTTGPVTSSIDVDGQAVACPGGLVATWTATITFANDDVNQAVGSTPVLSACRQP